MKLFILSVFIFLFINCSKKLPTNQLNIINLNNITESDTFALIPDLIKDWHYIPLETTDSSLLDIITQIEFDEDYIFVHAKNLYVFDQNGKYLHQIGAQGRGPGEYIKMEAWNINPYQKEVVILDAIDLKVKRYNYDGKFKNASGIEKNTGMISKFFFLKDGDVLAVNAPNYLTKEEWILLDQNFQQKKTLTSRNVKYEGKFFNSFINNAEQGNDSMVLFCNYCDTLYQYQNKHLLPIYYMDIYKTVPANFATQGQNIEDLDTQLKNYYKRLLTYETDRYLIQCLNTKVLLWDKIRKQGLYCDHGQLKRPIPGGSTGIIRVYQNQLISLETHMSLESQKQFYLEEKIKLPEKFENLLEETKEEDNPVLLFYELKDSFSTQE